MESKEKNIDKKQRRLERRWKKASNKYSPAPRGLSFGMGSL